MPVRLVYSKHVPPGGKNFDVMFDFLLVPATAPNLDAGFASLQRSEYLFVTF
jgi:hypothetical protein